MQKMLRGGMRQLANDRAQNYDDRSIEKLPLLLSYNSFI